MTTRNNGENAVITVKENRTRPRQESLREAYAYLVECWLRKRGIEAEVEVAAWTC